VEDRGRADADGTSGRWRLIRQRTLFESQYLRLRACDYRLPDANSTRDWYVVDEGAGVHVVTVTRRGRFLVVRQFRPAVDRVVYDFPGGFLEARDPDPAARARAELFEETGHRAGRCTYLGSVNPAPHRMHKVEHCFLALDWVPAGERVGGAHDEITTVEDWSAGQLRRRIRDGTFDCGICLAALAKAALVEPELADLLRPDATTRA
jgi:ADP-ribose pyrophosphatase